MEYIFYKVGIVEYQNPSYVPGPELTSQDDPTREEVMQLLEIQQPNYFENLEGLYNNKNVIRVNQIEVGYTYWMLTPISIAYQAERIQIAKANIRTSINSKGGTITTEERLDKYADAISAIAGDLVENRIVEFTNTNLVVIALSIWCGGGGAGSGYLSVLGSMSSDGTNPTTLRSMTSWSTVGWKYFYIFVDKSQHRYIQIGAPRDKSYYIKLTKYNLGIKETYTAYSWIDLNDVKGMLCEFQASASG